MAGNCVILALFFGAYCRYANEYTVKVLLILLFGVLLAIHIAFVRFVRQAER